MWKWERELQGETILQTLRFHGNHMKKAGLEMTNIVFILDMRSEETPKLQLFSWVLEMASDQMPNLHTGSNAEGFILMLSIICYS